MSISAVILIGLFTSIFIATPTNRIPVLSPLPQIFLFESNADLLRQLKDIVLFARKTSEKVTIDTKINSQSAQKNKVLRKVTGRFGKQQGVAPRRLWLGRTLHIYTS